MSHHVAEYTYIHPRTQEEAMVRRETRRHGLVVDVYLYRDSKFLVPVGRRGLYKIDPELGYRYPWIKFKVGKNPLFVHATHPGAALGFLIDQGFTSGGQDPREAELTPWP